MRFLESKHVPTWTKIFFTRIINDYDADEYIDSRVRLFFDSFSQRTSSVVDCVQEYVKHIHTYVQRLTECEGVYITNSKESFSVCQYKTGRNTLYMLIGTIISGVKYALAGIAKTNKYMMHMSSTEYDYKVLTTFYETMTKSYLSAMSQLPLLQNMCIGVSADYFSYNTAVYTQGASFKVTRTDSIHANSIHTIYIAYMTLYNILSNGINPVYNKIMSIMFMHRPTLNTNPVMFVTFNPFREPLSTVQVYINDMRALDIIKECDAVIIPVSVFKQTFVAKARHYKNDLQNEEVVIDK